MAEAEFQPVHYTSSPYNSMTFYVDLAGKSTELICENGTFMAKTKAIHEAVEAELERNVTLRSRLRKVDKAAALAVAQEAKDAMLAKNRAQQGPFQSVHAVSAEARNAAIYKEAAANNAQASAAEVTKALTQGK